MNLTHKDLTAWLDALAQKQAVIAPCQVSGVVLYQPVKQADEIAWGFTRPAMSPKEAFFPPTESLFTIQKDEAGVHIHETLPKRQQVVFGVRPCDARGLQALDALFIENEPIDPYYAQRRANTTMVGLACQEPGPTCFCERVGGAPDDPRGLDILLKEVNGGYDVQILTEKGLHLYSQAPNVPQEIRIEYPQFTIHNPPLLDMPASFDDDYWMEMSERCLSCRICAYVCPTCRCFDVRDEAIPGENGGQAYERLRCWDSCARETYRAIAGGHNPRAVKGERLRNRFMCKFYYYPQQYGASSPVACTGCGRCVDACPVNIDITEVLDHLLEVSR